jgi:hypothetical protein
LQAPGAGDGQTRAARSTRSRRRQAGISHEDFAVQVAALLAAGSVVISRWQTGPFDVEVRAEVLDQPGTAPSLN